MAVATARIITRGLGPFVPFPWLPIALGAFASAMVTTVALPARTTGGRLVVAITFMTVGLQLLLLTHPDMPINDAIFQTHRFQDVLGGHYLFASLAPGNYRFPYPIGLYLFARPFAAFAPTTADRMMLLRVIVVRSTRAPRRCSIAWSCAGEATSSKRSASVVAYHLLPLGFGVIVTANLTNVFAQSLATITLVVAGARGGRSWRPDGRMTAVVGALAAAAFLSHTSTFAVLGTQLVLAGGALAVSRGRVVAAVRTPARRRGDRRADRLDRRVLRVLHGRVSRGIRTHRDAKPDTRQPQPVAGRRSRASSICRVDWRLRSACPGCCSRSPAPFAARLAAAPRHRCTAPRDVARRCAASS